jgi:hypothetical protein
MNQAATQEANEARTTAPSLPRFVAKVFLWLVPSFALWYFAAPLLAWPLGFLARLGLWLTAGSVVSAIEMNGATLSVVTALRPESAPLGAAAVLVPEVNTLAYSFGLPLLAALLLAAREGRWPTKLAIAYVALLPFQAFGVVSDVLRQIAIISGPGVIMQAGFSAWQRELIVFCYQFGTLIVPAVAPAILWVLLDRRFLERWRGPAS